jgi:glyoxylase-like metal-dependent hydrolase (beta-lactamase superfamily II)
MSAVTQFTRMGWVNAYLVQEDDGITLIDTTIGGSTKRILAAAKQLGAPIVRIVLTHAHRDHVGSLDALPDAEVIASEREARVIAGDRAMLDGEPHSKLRGSYPKMRTMPTRTVTPGERIGSLEVLAAPGHTPGHIALLDTRDRTLLCGDAFTTLGGVATSARSNPRFPFAAMATWDRPIELATARALRALEPARLGPGHGRIVESPAPHMDAAIARAAK